VNNADLQKQYEGQVLTLRQFYQGEHLHFDAAGKLAYPGMPGAWTVDGKVRVKDISLKDGVVHIRAQRLFLFFDPETKQLRDVGSVTKTDSASNLFREKVDEWAAKQGKIEIEVECGVTQPEMADLTKAMNAVFLAPGESLAGVLPDLWKGYDAGNYLDPKGRGAYRVGGSVSAPHKTYAPEPPYTETARGAQYHHALTVLFLIVDPDGLPQNIRVAKASGMGLDEAAASTVSTWRFDPAKKDGSPVAVMINLEVSFHLF
jgi:TonB family protein